MRTYSKSAAVLCVAMAVATVAAQGPEVERVYFVPAQFVRMQTESVGRVVSNKAIARVGEVHDGTIGREWSIQIPNGQTLEVQDRINDKGKIWYRIVPESLISQRFAPRSSLNHGNPWQRRTQLENNSRNHRAVPIASTWNGMLAALGGGESGVARAAHAQPVPSIPPMSDFPMPTGPADSFVMPPAPNGFSPAAPVPGQAPRGNPPNGYSSRYAPRGYGSTPPYPANCNTPPSNASAVLIPPMISRFFDNANLNVELTTQHEFNVFGRPAGDLVLYERDGVGVFNDLVSIPGTGRDASGDNIDDTFDVSEPLPPNDIPTAPSPSAVYTGGTATYTGGVGNTAIDGQFGDNSVWRAQYGFAETLEMVAPGGVQRSSVADNNSPVPRDRIHFNYRYYHNATAGFGSVHRYTFGVEKAFLNDWFSIDARLPFAGGWDSVRFEDSPVMSSTDFGDVSLYAKSLIVERRTVLVSGGLGIAFPTGPDSRLFRSDGSQVVWIKNESLHLLPFLGSIWAPNNYFYVQSFVQLDFDAHGNTVSGSSAAGRLPTIGKLSDSTTFNSDTSLGYWILRDRGPQYLMQGLAAILEFNYTTTLGDAHSVSADGIRITSPTNKLKVFDLSTGIHAQLGRSLALTSAITIPLGKDYNKRSDWEIAGMVSWLF